MRMILTQHLAHDTGRFLVRLVEVVLQLRHTEEHAPMHRLEAVAHIRERSRDDNRHRVIDVAGPHLVFDIDL